MPVLMGENHPLPFWGSDRGCCKSEPHGGSLQIALVNNMPDAALEDTEVQFLELLDAASGDIPVTLQLFSLPKVPRAERGEQHLASFYSSTLALGNGHIDGMIVTGTEPRQANLRNEPYWDAMAELFDWAERNTHSTVLSCLAAHAGVLHSDEIARHPLKEKKLGVFASRRTSASELTAESPEVLEFPHSRWNEVREEELNAAGYNVVLASPEAGVDLFTKQKRKSLFLHFQGHPEYGARTLLKEYRRDVKRFLRGERTNYPNMPRGYLDDRGSAALDAFEKEALASPREELVLNFPEATAAAGLRKTWHDGAVSIYRNWLRFICAKKGEFSKPVVESREVQI